MSDGVFARAHEAGKANGRRALEWRFVAMVAALSLAACLMHRMHESMARRCACRTTIKQ